MTVYVAAILKSCLF